MGPLKIGTKNITEDATTTYSLNVFLVLLVSLKMLYFSFYKQIPRLFSKVTPNLFLQLTSLKEFPPITPRFYFQLAMLNRPVTMVVTMAGACLLPISIMIQLAEKPAPTLLNPKSQLIGQFNNYLDSLWHTLCSMALIGYGDLIPQTYLGRAISLLAIFTGILLV